MSEVKLAISSDDDSVSGHFGRCQKYIMVTIKDGQMIKREEVPNPGHQPGFLPQFLKEQGVNVIIAGGAGPRAQELLNSYGIDCILGISGNIDEVLDLYLKGKLVPGQSQCEHEI